MPRLPEPPPGLERKADDALEAAVTAIAAVQDDVRAADGRYLQLLPSHATLPKDGADVAHDRLARKPSARAQSWQDVGVTPPSAPVRFRCDEYLAPTGPGWTVTAEIEIAGRTWARTVDGAGPEMRAHGWVELPELEA